MKTLLTTTYRIEQELSRLEKNADRRQVREKQGKGKRKNAQANAGSPGASGSADKAAGGTTRKCANCGQIGHIKTNKRYIAIFLLHMSSPTLRSDEEVSR